VSSTTADARTELAFPRLRRRLLRVVIALALLVAVGYAFGAFVNIDTNLLWFRSVDHESVYTRTFWTQALLFALFGSLMAAAVGLSLSAVYRNRPAFNPHPIRQRWRWRFHRFEPRIRTWLFIVVVAYLTVSMGSRAAGSWQTWLLWRHSVPFGGPGDPQFHRDASYYLFTYPMHRMVLTYAFRIVATALLVSLIAAYLYGGVRIRGTGPRMTRAVNSQLSVIVGVYLVLKAFAYWLDRYALATSNRGVVTGVGYTDAHAVLPGRIVLMVVALIAAALLFANAVVQRPRLVSTALVLMVGGALVIGMAWPWAVQHFREKPSASVLELPAISHNIAATRNAFGLSNTVTSTPFPDVQTLHGKSLGAQVKQNAQIRLVDPNRMSATFNVKQQMQGYYGFKSTLDIDRYPIEGASRDVAIAVRELNLAGLPAAQRSWANTHLVYTHGYGVAAATTDHVLRDGLPDFVESDLPPKGLLTITQPRIYYGQMSPSYSIVGGPTGSKAREFDLPGAGSAGTIGTTHTGGGGIPVGSAWHRLLYAWKLHSSSILFSSVINNDSQLLTVRDPRARIAAVAPWLTLDGDAYPTVVGGHIEWVVDGYTTTNRYPDSQQVNLRSATSNTLTQTGSTVPQSGTSINYMRNSVKATVDAYSGKVTLYQWDPQNTPDPILASWEQSFPGLIQPQTSIPADLLAHLRYPQDMFNVQRSLLTQYHVTKPGAFYDGSAFWTIPTDPTVGSTTQLNAVGKPTSVSAPTQPSVYMSLSATGTTPASFALSTPLVTLNQRSLAAFLSVNAQPGPGYGQMTLLELPAGGLTESPSQVQNDIDSDPAVVKQLSDARQGHTRVVLGNLLTIPLAGQMLYVEPIYFRASWSSSFPILRRVAVVYGDGGKVAYRATLSQALDQALGLTHQP
jgi:uncharacterized membrane protein (UPF0182 family)